MEGVSLHSVNLNQLKMAADVSLPILRLHRLTKDQQSLGAQKNNNKPGRKPTRKNSTGKGNDSADTKSVSSQVSPAPKRWGRPKGSKNKPKISLQLSSIILRPDAVKQEVKQEMDELPIGTRIEHCLNAVKPESYDPEMGNTREPPTESDPKTDARHLGIKTEDSPLYFQDGRRRLRSATGQPLNLTAFRSDPEWRPRNQKVRRFPCPDCGRKFFSKTTLKFHSRIHTQYRPYSCDVCRKTFSRKAGLDEHRPIHDAERPFACHQCGRTFTFKSNLTRHMRFHSDAQPYVCSQCGQGFKISAHLKRHMTAHSGCKLFVCPECGQSFVRYMSLKYHRLSHTGERPLSCPECPMTFARPQTFMVHRLKHTGETPFSCQDCGNSSNRGAS
ncbi:myeloid zinc finger 1 [Coregonus clupeaformis]|uniref:myeloid zinc finger 1 n=1 Tax=Coregonus clupeaformis TaxID=59861 RepID=UPI001E1C8810|nr:myeloid zinc finger 1 [Coregonus clupeaformis]XP_041696889.2 myeloid zinc finger 1 [Coregonus clupeaformis]XP_045061518.1 myeloid zinc finger 1 [Coregonus clupeaformis]XP_045061519.1 myeloid zinc finger 1 [Coregonus clupeaformis]XP_045061520.1 myeloid zinc finger 1 [Coregonus clupeaformis]